MAYTKIHAIKATVDKAIDYICNPDKTDDKIFISSYACSPETAAIDFKYTLDHCRENNPNKAYHLIQAFAPGEVSFEEAHKIGQELADRVLEGNYSYVVTTHIDKGHVHNHIIFCAADNINHDKYHDCNKRINSVSPRTLLKIVLYSYMNHDYSSRSMELNCKRDINFMYLLEGAKAPDHATFARFRSIHFAPYAKRILAETSNFLYQLGEVSGEAIFIDGTKIAACANKYTFVWKKAVTKNQAKLLLKIADLIAECEKLYDIKIIYGNAVKMKHVKRLRKKLFALKEQEGLVFVHGIGKRKSPLQKSIEKLEEYLAKLKEYTQKVYVCGSRNSYSCILQPQSVTKCKAKM